MQIIPRIHIQTNIYHGLEPSPFTNTAEALKEALIFMIEAIQECICLGHLLTISYSDSPFELAQFNTSRWPFWAAICHVHSPFTPRTAIRPGPLQNFKIVFLLGGIRARVQALADWMGQKVFVVRETLLGYNADAEKGCADKWGKTFISRKSKLLI